MKKNESLDSLISSSSSLNKNEIFSQIPSKIEILRLKTLKFLASSFLGSLYINFFLLVSIFSCGQYIYQTYLNPNQQVEGGENKHDSNYL